MNTTTAPSVRISIWREEKRKVARGTSGKFRSVKALVSDDAPGLFVLMGNWFSLDDSKPEVEGFYGGKVHLDNTGTFITDAYHGTQRPCALAIELAKLHDWTTAKPGSRGCTLTHEAFVALEELLRKADEEEQTATLSTPSAA